MQHMQRGTLRKVHVSFHEHDNGKWRPCSLIYILIINVLSSWWKFEKNVQNQSLLEDLFQETIYKSIKNVAIPLTITMVIKCDACSFCKVPPFDVLHHTFWMSTISNFLNLYNKNFSDLMLLPTFPGRWSAACRSTTAEPPWAGRAPCWVWFAFSQWSPTGWAWAFRCWNLRTCETKS